MLKLGAILLISIGLFACQPNLESSDSRAFSVLNQQVQGQAQVTPDYLIQFPRDHASHPQFAIEWWYITANLKDNLGQDYGLQWTLFRFLGQAHNSPWANAQQYMAHVGLHNASQSWFEERFARGGVGNAGVSQYPMPFVAYLDNWRWHATGTELFPSTLVFDIEDNVQVELTLNTEQDFVLHGQAGYSKKLANDAQASYYYSQPHIEVVGSLRIDGQHKPVTGQAWFDHEWTSQYLDQGGTGWDWFSIHLASGKKLMLFNVRHKIHGDFWSGTLVLESGQSMHLPPQKITTEIIETANIGGRAFPVRWRLSVPDHQLALVSEPIKKDQLHPGLFSYYEGAVRISGSDTGVGFMELTGY